MLLRLLDFLLASCLPFFVLIVEETFFVGGIEMTLPEPRTLVDLSCIFVIEGLGLPVFRGPLDSPSLCSFFFFSGSPLHSETDTGTVKKHEEK